MKKAWHVFLLVCYCLTARAQTLSLVQATNSPYTLSNMMRGVTSGDVNGDGNKDVLICSANTSNIYVMLGNGSGQFTAAPGTPINIPGGQAIFIALADFNGDLNLDVATANYSIGSISVFLGSGNGSFTQASGSPTCSPAVPAPIAFTCSSEMGPADFHRPRVSR